MPIGASMLALLSVLVLILGCVAMVIGPAYMLVQRDDDELREKAPRETRCVRGYVFDVLPDGRTRQVIGQDGHGVRCEERNR